MQLEWITWLQGHQGPLLSVMQAASWLGRGIFYVLAGAVVLWVWDRKAGTRLLYLLAGSGAANAVLKAAFHAPRPYWLTDGIVGYEVHTSFGMPSGHAQSAMVFFGLVALTWRRAWVVAASAAAVLLIGLSRIALGVHTPAQVAAGWGVGLCLLTAFWASDRGGEPWTWTPKVGVSVTLALTGAFLAAGVLLARLYAHWTPNSAWAARAGRPFPAGGLPVQDIFRNTGFFAGLGLGFTLLRPQAAPSRQWAWLRAGLGSGGVVAVLAAGRLLHLRSQPGWVQFAAASFLGLWIAAIAWVCPPTGHKKGARHNGLSGPESPKTAPRPQPVEPRDPRPRRGLGAPRRDQSAPSHASLCSPGAVHEEPFTVGGGMTIVVLPVTRSGPVSHDIPP